MFTIFKKKPKNYKDIVVEEFQELATQPGCVILDVRTKRELTEGKIPGSIMIDYFDISFRKKVAKLDKSKKYLIYCRSGNRSGKSCKLMSTIGFENLYNLKGGIIAWNRAPQIT